MNKKFRDILHVVIFIFLAFFGINFFTSWNNKQHREIHFSDFVHTTQKGRVKAVNIKGQVLTGETYEGDHFTTRVPYQDLNLIDRLLAHQVDIKIAKTETSSMMNTIVNVLQFLLWIAVLFFCLKGNLSISRMGGKTRRYEDESDHQITFAEVAGADEAKESLEEIVEFLKNPEKFSNAGAKIPRGMLLTGDPGVGKTLLAKAVAGEAGVPFFFASGSQFVEVFVGVGAQRVRELFETARKHAPCIIFIDELDSLAAKRGVRASENPEQDQTLNQLLVELDGFDTREGVIVIGATNRPDILDKAVLRAGRIDRKVHVSLPSLQQRIDILAIYTLNLMLNEDVDLISLARQTIGSSGAELASIVNEAIIIAVREHSQEEKNSKSLFKNGSSKRNRIHESLVVVSMAHFVRSLYTLFLGKPMKNNTLRLEDKTLTAYHEGAHAVMAYLSPQSHPIAKVTIVPHGSALGFVLRLPEYDEVSRPLDRIIADIRVALAGRIGEYLYLGEDKITTGASSDIQAATQMAYSMVRKWGMSDLGMILYASWRSGDHDLLNDGISISDRTRDQIDKEIQKIINTQYDYALNILRENWPLVHGLAQELLERETMDGGAVYSFLDAKSKTLI